MAKQKGVIKLVGTIDDLTFARTKDGYTARQKTYITADHINSMPSFQRTRENMAEFGAAGKAGKVLRTAIRPLLLQARDGSAVGRLSSAMMKVLKADTTSARGFRNVIDGDQSLLQGFEFNLNGKLSSTVFAPYTATINRVTGKLDAAFDPYIPTAGIVAPPGTTHYKIVSMGAELDYATGDVITDEQSSALIAYDATATAALTLSNTVTANSTNSLYLVLGVQFFQEVNGTQYPLNDSSHNALAVVKVDQA